jgi:eukaryotic-like serine/threonine-protein kinase
MSTLVGSTVSSRFRVEGILGEGKMGRVYDAVDVELGRRVAIKVMHSSLCSDAHFLERFWREAKTIAPIVESTRHHYLRFRQNRPVAAVLGH